MKKINYVRNYIKKEAIVAYCLVQSNCTCCAVSLRPLQIGTLVNGVPVPLFGTGKFKLLQELVGKRLDHDNINGLMKNGLLPFAGDWEQPHMAAPYDHNNIIRLD